MSLTTSPITAWPGGGGGGREPEAHLQQNKQTNKQTKTIKRDKNKTKQTNKQTNVQIGCFQVGTSHTILSARRAWVWVLVYMRWKTHPSIYQIPESAPKEQVGAYIMESSFSQHLELVRI